MDQATATLIASGAATVVALLVLWVNWRQNRRLAANSRTLETIHVLVNDRLDRALVRIEEMKGELDNLKAGLPRA